MNGFKDRILWLIWFGDTMSHNRLMAFKTLHSINFECTKVLINEENVKDVVVEDHPLHEAFGYLSSTHKSDYLSAYILYHYGGGYCGIKPYTDRMAPYFNILEKSDKDFIGCSEFCEDCIAADEIEIKEAYSKLVSMQRVVFKKNTYFAKMWLQEVEKVLSAKLPQLKIQDGLYHPRAITGGAFQCDDKSLPKNYPIRWNEICGKIFHKIQYHNQNLFINGIRLELFRNEQYR